MKHVLVLLLCVTFALGADVGCSHSKSSDGHAGHCLKNGCCMYNYQTTSSSLCNGADETCCYRDTKPECGGGVTTHAGCPHIVSRATWGARAPKPGIGTLTGPVKYVFIHHAESGACHSETECARLVRGFQAYHMDSNGWSDIGYSFLVGEDGNAYEGRGWDHVGAHTQNYNSVGLGFCMIGSFTSHTPNAAAISTVQALIACGVSNGKIQSNYILRGHRDMNQTDCPGNALYALIKTWSHY